jgi:hypothetical protein
LVTEADTVLAAALGAAARSALPVFIGEAQLYCADSDCSIRAVVLTIKELDGPTTPATMFCPACGNRLTVRHVVTLDERRDAFERDARTSVNEQLYRQRTGSQAVPLGVVLDDSLPPEGTTA